MPIADHQRERCAAAASRIQNAFATCPELTLSRARLVNGRSRAAVVNAAQALAFVLAPSGHARPLDFLGSTPPLGRAQTNRSLVG